LTPGFTLIPALAFTFSCGNHGLQIKESAMRQGLVLSALFALLLLLTLGRSTAQEQPKPEPKPEAPKEEPKIVAAREVLSKLSPRDRALVDACRWLVHPVGQDDALKGLFNRPNPLPPLDAPPKGPLTTLEALRLLALLHAGYPATESLLAHIARLAKSKALASDKSLAPLAIQMLCLQAALARGGLEKERELKSLAQRLWREEEGSTAPTTNGKPWADGDVAQPQWFANVFWRALFIRAAASIGIAQKPALLAGDLEHLWPRYYDTSKMFIKRAGAFAANYGESLDINNCAFAAARLASELPADLLPKATSDKAAAMAALAPSTLDRLGKVEWYWRGNGGIRGARGFFMAILRAAPPARGEITDAQDWNVAAQRACQTADGCLEGSVEVCTQLGLNEETPIGVAEANLIETCLAISAVSGGPLPAKRDSCALEAAKWPECFDALLVLHAAQARSRPDLPFDKRVARAISDGCEFLVQHQEPDGCFNKGGARTGYQAVCLMALLHSSYSRNHEAVKRGFRYLDSVEWGYKDGFKTGYSYDAGILLMLLELFYEPELLTSGMLKADSPKKYAEARKAMWALISKPHQDLVMRLLASLGARKTKSGWSYTPDQAAQTAQGDNSNSQYAMLGFKAAALLGAEFDIQVFKDEAERLLTQFSDETTMPQVSFSRKEQPVKDAKPKKNEGTGGKNMVQPGGWGYISMKSAEFLMQMAAAGISSLMVCMDELKLRGVLEPALEARIEKTLNAALAFTSLRYYKADGSHELYATLSETQHGWGLYYNLYSIERGCMLAGVTQLQGGIDWHRIGSEILLDQQSKDGAWRGYQATYPTSATATSTPPIIDTCLAILFLKAAAMPVLTEPKRKEEGK
jgi:hypothetical protein